MMGIAGSGKGTQGALLAKEHNLHVISTGELLRTYGSKEQHERMLTGEILADEEVTALLNTALNDLHDQNAVILDGYPRRISQADWLIREAKNGHFRLDKVLHLLVSREAVKTRLLERGRQDDHDFAIEERFNEYERATMPILKHLEDAGVPVLEINGEQSVDAVHQAIIAAI